MIECPNCGAKGERLDDGYLCPWPRCSILEFTPNGGDSE